MNSTRIIPVFALFALLLSFSAVGVEDGSNPKISGKSADAEYPFVATVIGNEVYIRSGKGTAYYHCGKVNQDDKITVFEEIFGWAKVLPPEGCYSWIHKDFVDVETDKPTVGVLKGDSVRVWAGSDYIQPMRSSSMQTKLNSGEIIELMPDQPASGDYYKIKPPTGAYLWISCDFLKYAGPVEPVKPVVIPQRKTTLPKPTIDIPPSTETAIPKFSNVNEGTVAADIEASKAATPKPAVTKPAATAKAAIVQEVNIEACYTLSTKIDQELQKPLLEQNYDDIRKSLKMIKAGSKDSKAVAYAQILLERVQGYELAISVVNTLKEQDKTLTQTKEQIDKAREEKIKKLPKEVHYIYSGVLKESHVYTKKTGQKRYLILDPNGKILCYAVASSKEATAQLDSLLGSKVGIQGTVSDSQNSLKTLIEVTTTTELK